MKLKKFLIKLINFYQRKSLFVGKQSCVFYPTCSEYTKQALEKYGAIRGSYLGFRRILRCHPFAQPKIDNIP